MKTSLQKSFGRTLIIILGVMLLWAATVTSVFAYNYGDRVQCTVNLNVRATASTSGTLVTTETSGSKGTIESGTSQSANGYTWWYITWDNSYTGWSVDSLQLVAATPPGATTQAATAVTSSGATLNGLMTPNGASTTAYFQYGTSTSYGSTSSTAGPFTTSQSLNYAVSGLAASTIYHFRFVANNSGGTTYGNDLTFTTSANVVAPTVTTLPASSITTSSAQLNGNANPNGLATTVYFQYGTTTSYGITTSLYGLGSGTSAQGVTATPTGLTPSTTYHFRIVAYSSGGTSYGIDQTFNTAGITPPGATTQAATAVTSSGATLNGLMTPNGASTTAYFQYGTSTSYGSTSSTAGPFTTSQSLNYAVSGLAASTIYHFRFVANNSGGTTYGNDLTFTTSANVVAPTVTTLPASSITTSSAQLNGNANPNGLATRVYFQYGTTTSYGITTSLYGLGSGTSAQGVTATPTGLTPSTTYHFRIVAYSSGGTSYGIDQTFNTAGITPPGATTQAATAVTSSGATLNGLMTPNGASTTAYFQYGTSTSYGSTSSTAGPFTTSQSLNYATTGLTASTMYHFRFVATSSGGTTYGSDLTFTTTSLGAMPNITTQPQSQTVQSGANNVTFTVVASATSLNYQWQKNGVNISGAVGSTLTLNSVTAANSGGYSVVVSNPYGSVTSATASLAVLTDGANGNTPIPVSAITVPSQPAGKDSLVFITHGLEPFYLVVGGDISWMTDMAEAIQSKSPNWEVRTFDWRAVSWFPEPDVVLAEGAIGGQMYGEQLAQQHWKFVHLIAHSAGAAVIEGIAKALKASANPPVIQETFLDPYSGFTTLVGRSVYGANADWADNYSGFGDFLDIAPALLGIGNSTDGRLDYAYNVDVSWVDPNHQTIPLGSFGEVATSSHGWPYEFYTETVLGTETGCATGYGFPLSKEGGGWNNNPVNYPEGLNPLVLCGPSDAFQNPFQQQSLIQLALDGLSYAVSDATSVIVSGTSAVLNSIWSVIPHVDSGGIHPLDDTSTNIPAWLAVGVRVTNAVNFVQFDAAFTDANSAQGLLTVYWNTNQIGMVDERVATTNLQTYRFELPDTVPGNSKRYVCKFVV